MLRRFQELILAACGRVALRVDGRLPSDSPTTVALAVLIFLATVVTTAGDEPRDAAARLTFFETKVRPLLVQRCYECHSEELAEGTLRLDIRSGWERGGERGPAIVPGDPSASLLIRAVTYRDKKLQMPPPDSGGKLSDAEIETLVTWIRQGATDPRVGEKIVTNIEQAAATHWAFQPITAPKVEPGEHPLDALIERQLRQQDFVAAEPADPGTLIRRMTFDLLGLPPTATEIAEFERDCVAELPVAELPVAELLRNSAPSHGATRPPETPPATPQPAKVAQPPAVKQLIKRLLDSPRYGERWGRHWLDVARYSDAKDGVLMYGDARIRPFAYTYRDYVIRAFNQDKPFDRFIREQLAADQLDLPPDSPDLAAMGLLTLGRLFDRNRHDVIDDQIDVIGRGFLGLSLACARCHDHKYDPVPTADYYSLYGIFASTIEPYDRPRIGPVTESGQTCEQELAAKLKEVNDTEQAHYLETLRIARDRTPDYLVHVATTEPDVSETTYFFLSLIPDQLRPQVTRRWRQLIARRAFPDDPVFGPWHDLMRDIAMSAEPHGTALLRPDEWKNRGIDQRIIDGLATALTAQPPATAGEAGATAGLTRADVARAYGTIIRAAWAAGGDESDPLAGLLVARDGPVWFPIRDVVFYLSRQPGDAFRGLVGQLDGVAVKHRDAAPRAMIVRDAEVLCDPVIFQRGDPSARGAPVPRRFLQFLSPAGRPPFTQGSGRLELADAIASPTNPLTARVWVNRVWMHHFGEPLVDSPSDFGLQARRPVQLELLDFLADYFIRNGWRTKPLHELIMTSRAYQRSSLLPDTEPFAKQRQADPSNALLWRGQRRRLELEPMRDTLLAVTGELDDTMFGRPVVITDESNRRRTVYAFVERQNIPDMVQSFDFANTDTSTPRRNVTTVPQQALFALNSPFMLARADVLAKRVAESEPSERVLRLYVTVLGRAPTPAEHDECQQFLATGTLEQLAQVLLMSNELMFVD